MKPISKSKVNGFIYIGLLTNLATPLISCFPSAGMREAATAFFKQAINVNGLPSKVVMDKSCANYVGLETINFLLRLAGLISFVEIRQVKYLNNLIEQDHRFIKKITQPIMGFKDFHSAKATIDGIETAHDPKETAIR